MENTYLFARLLLRLTEIYFCEPYFGAYPFFFYLLFPNIKNLPKTKIRLMLLYRSYRKPFQLFAIGYINFENDVISIFEKFNVHLNDFLLLWGLNLRILIGKFLTNIIGIDGSESFFINVRNTKIRVVWFPQKLNYLVLSHYSPPPTPYFKIYWK